MKRQFDPTLYAVTDNGLLAEKSIVEAVKEAIAGGATLIQLREKLISSRDFLSMAFEIKKLIVKQSIPLIINDRLDIALACNADGLHIGQDDIPLPIARKILGNDRIIGVSVSTIDEALEAEKDGADYLGVGAMFPTNTKNDACTVSIDTLTKIRESADIPVVAIGGINEMNALQLKDARIHGIAVVSAIFGHDDISGRSRIMRGLAEEITKWKTV